MNGKDGGIWKARGVHTLIKMKRGQKALSPKQPGHNPTRKSYCTPDSAASNPFFSASRNIPLHQYSNTQILKTMSTPPVPPTDLAQADTVLFRPTKKRKIYRQRASEDEPTPPSVSSPEPPAAASVAEAQSLDDLISTASGSVLGNGPVDVGAAPVSMAEILRMRKKNKTRGGVEFKASGHVARDEEGELILRPDEEALGSSGVPRKFAPQTGAVGDVNRHM